MADTRAALQTPADIERTKRAGKYDTLLRERVGTLNKYGQNFQTLVPFYISFYIVNGSLLYRL